MRAKKAVVAMRNFLKRHMKSEEILLGKNLNDAIWVHGIRNPPHKLKIVAKKDDEGVVRAELFGYEYKDYKRAQKAEESSGLMGKLKGVMGKEEKNAEKEEAPEAKKEERKKEATKKESSAKKEEPEKAAKK